MAQFSLPNVQTGGSSTITANSLQEAQQIAQSQGTWTPAAGTYGANSILGTSSGGGGGGGGGAAIPGYSATDPLSGLAQFAAQTSGVTQKQLDQQKAEFDAQLQFAKDQMTQLGIPQLQINQMLANLQQQQFQSGLALTQQSQQFNQAATAAALTGYYNAPAPVPSVQPWLGGAGTTIGQTTPTGGAGGAGGWSAPTQDQYVTARTAQLQQVGGMSAAQAQQTATSEWSQGYAQSGNVAYGLPAGISFTQPAGTAGGAAPTTGGGDAASYVAARTQQLVGQGMPTAQATQTAQAEWAQGYAQSGNVAYGLPPGWSMGTAQGAGNAATPGTAQGTPTLANILQQAQLSGMYNGAPTETAREFNANLALQQGQLGQQYLSTAAQLQGPQNTFQLSNYLRGAQGNPNVPAYLQALSQNIGMPAFQAPGTTAPTVQSAAGLAGQLGGTTSATPGWDYNQTLGTIQNIMNAGAQKLGPGALENLTPDELQAFGSGLGAAGGSLPAFMQQYTQSRIGQQAPTATTSLA